MANVVFLAFSVLEGKRQIREPPPRASGCPPSPFPPLLPFLVLPSLPLPLQAAGGRLLCAGHSPQEAPRGLLRDRRGGAQCPHGVVRGSGLARGPPSVLLAETRAVSPLCVRVTGPSTCRRNRGAIHFFIPLPSGNDRAPSRSPGAGRLSKEGPRTPARVHLLCAGHSPHGGRRTCKSAAGSRSRESHLRPPSPPLSTRGLRAARARTRSCRTRGPGSCPR